jgi:hypothetical protein
VLPAQIGGVQQHTLAAVDDTGALDREQEPFVGVEVNLGIRETRDGIRKVSTGSVCATRP